MLRGRVFVALHMHAGDGNVHTNIPVNSDDYAMLQTAQRRGGAHHGARARARRRDLRRARHRHHQARVPDRRRDRARSRDYKQRVDPEGRFNKGKLLPGARPAPTPTRRSFSLLGARVADHAAERHRRDLATRSRTACAAASASRCAPPTCRAPTCSTSPRNKILATSLLIEAFLYEEQTRRGISLAPLGRVRRRRRPLHGLPQVRDALPGGHRLRRRLDGHAQPAAQAWARRRFSPGTAASMFFLNATDPQTIKLMRSADDRLGLQGAAPRPPRCSQPAAARADRARRRPRSAPAPLQGAGRSTSSTSRCPAACRSSTARALLDIEDQRLRADHPRPGATPAEDPRRCSTSPAAARSGCSRQVGPGHAGDALARRRADRAAAGLPVLRLPADAARASSTRPRRSSPTTGCCSTASPTRSTTSTSRPWSCRCGTCYDQLQDYEFERDLPRLPHRSTSTSTCWRRASSSTA
ncbi:MAG: hypothetical protein MZW92_78395 [Comamonadaceae bacterium]|nr:hypothetical protein [Comamonadaceae bacterium]